MAESPDYDSLKRVTVSRDALRADLAEMELRLRVYFDDQLKHKADSATVSELALKMDKLDRGEWTEVHRRALEELIKGQERRESDKSWTSRERTFGVAVVIMTLISLVASLWFSTHSASAQTQSSTPITSVTYE